MKLYLAAALAASALACGSSTNGGSGITSDASATEPDGGGSCHDAFADACTRAQACGKDGRARVSYGGGSAIDYESGAYCSGVLPDSKCQAGAPQPPVDPSRCVAELPAAACTTLDDGHSALLMPASCH